MAKEKSKKSKKAPKTEKITVTDVSQPSNEELAKRINALGTRIDNLVTAISKAKKVKGI